jgi:hypothetical protein
MSVAVENRIEELDVLQGATITKVAVGPATIRLTVRFAPNLFVNGRRTAIYEIWQDGEGNGPGYLALVG